MPATLGTVTTSVFEHTPEAHKLHMEFTVTAALTVRKGDPVVFATNGRVQAAATAEPAWKIVGVAIMDGIAGEFVTIAMKAYCVVNAEAAAASLNAGPVKLGAWNATTVRREYAAAVITALDASTVDGTYGAQEQAVIENLRTKIEEYQLIVGWNITQATSDGDAIQVALFR